MTRKVWFYKPALLHVEFVCGCQSFLSAHSCYDPAEKSTRGSGLGWGGGWGYGGGGEVGEGIPR